ncbi:hypothetical protein [Klebsiella pneumoniae]|uniref:hypothetical protein n=1 Tax=Klebsiella pneumoniae TaxID=573 RepID=UPI003D36D0D0
MADIVSGLAALKTAFDLAKDLKNATSAYNDAEMRLKFSELYSALSDAKIDLADAQIEMYEMKQKIEELQTSGCANLRGAVHQLSKSPFRGLANSRTTLSLHYIVVSCSRH